MSGSGSDSAEAPGTSSPSQLSGWVSCSVAGAGVAAAVTPNSFGLQQ